MPHKKRAKPFLTIFVYPTNDSNAPFQIVTETKIKRLGTESARLIETMLYKHIAELDLRNSVMKVRLPFNGNFRPAFARLIGRVFANGKKKEAEYIARRVANKQN